MKIRFKREVVERELKQTGAAPFSPAAPGGLEVGNTIEYPFKGRKWRVVEVTADIVTLED